MTNQYSFYRFLAGAAICLVSTAGFCQERYAWEDSAWKKNIRIFNPPADHVNLPAWRKKLADWRAREWKTYEGSSYGKKGYEWVQNCFTTCFFIIHDSRFYNVATHTYDVDGFVDYYTREYGKLDAVIMWHLSPQIGFDDRNQFDFFRNMPGGLPGLREAVERFHEKGIRFFINHNPHNTGGWQNDNLRPESPEDPSGGPEAMAAIVRAVNADGVFLNTYDFGGEALQSALDKIKPGIAIEGETDLRTPEAIGKQHMEWFQGWYTLPYVPGGVIRNKWLERRHMIHQVYRNTKDHANELHAAWMNGTGMVVWENVFGIWRGWIPRDRSLLRSMSPVQRRFASLFTGEHWTPMVGTLASGVFANLWEEDKVRLWTVINHTTASQSGDIMNVDHRAGDRYFELISGRELKPVIKDGVAALSAAIPAKGIAGFLAIPAHKVDKGFEGFLAGQAAIKAKEDLSTAFGYLPVRLKPVLSTKKYKDGQLPAGMIALSDTVYTQRDTVRSRESGTYDNEQFSGGSTTYRKVSVGRIAIDEKPVTNGQFMEFLLRSKYQPAYKDNFLKHWINGAPPPGKENDPVVYVDIDDARAYAKWAGKRLPTLEEWQYAMETGKPVYGTTRVWEWNESERDDGRVRFVMLKGGSDWAAKGSRFYSTGGPQEPQYTAKYMLMYPGLDRIWTIGFRCVVDR